MMKFKIKCLCGQQMMIVTRSQRKVIRCPKCNQKIEAIAPADEHSLPELTGAIFDDGPLHHAPSQHAAAHEPFPVPASASEPQPVYESKIVKRPAAQFQKNTSSFNWVPLVVAISLAGLIIFFIVLLLLPENDVGTSGGGNTGSNDSTGQQRDRNDVIDSQFPVELGSPTVVDQIGSASLELEIKIGSREVLSRAGKVVWVIKTDSGKRFEENITYKVIYGMDNRGKLTYHFPEKIDRYPLSTYIEAVVDPDSGKIEPVSNVVVFNADGKILAH